MDVFAARSTSRTHSIAELRSVAASGLFRVSQFQRSFRWEAQGVLNLFDSILLRAFIRKSHSLAT